MTELSESMNRLINNWTITITANDQPRQQTFPPLVDMLAEHITPSVNFKGGGGPANTRNLIDTKSIDLLTHIQDVTRAWLREWNATSTGSLRVDLLAFWTLLNAYHHAGTITDSQHANLSTYPDTWATRIWDLIERPVDLPLRDTACPRCGTEKITNPDESRHDALRIIWREGQEVTAECRAEDCLAVWVGEPGLIQLGKAIGAEIDLEALDQAKNLRKSGDVLND